MKLKHWIRFLLYRDSTWHGQFSTLGPLLLGRAGLERTVVDVGANDGFYSSNSYPFIARGWRALLIEPHPAAFHKARQLHRKREPVTLLNAACSDRDGDLELQTYAEDEGGGLRLSAKVPVVSRSPLVRRARRFASKFIGWRRSWMSSTSREILSCLPLTPQTLAKSSGDAPVGEKKSL